MRMTTRRQAASQTTAGRGRKSMDGIKAFMSPRTPESTGRLDIKKQSGATTTDVVEKTEWESGTKRVNAQTKGDSVIRNGQKVKIQ
ncbi:hypothetical protein AB205_0015540 [Aquarana catesbeiana]|uniref:Uncharacterized protein n=1 Tax=Aquarana catesbeiana TaxID=8400 RepID=A0A2G9QF00_AQUCT|nr:hypothetical protein AB205_0015540 [Aquarana catesbeiana]